jgi:8-oxo-dGTP diphosphatase
MTDARIPAGPTPIIGVGAVIWNVKGEVVLIKRGKPPRLDEWSIPGGHLEWGETLKGAALREAREETGLTIELAGLIDVVDSLSHDEAGAVTRHYVLIDFAARAVAGKLCAGTDASEARWVPFAELGKFALWSETRRIIEASARLIRPALR